jgi:N-acetylglucosamine-6-sulfatase
VAALVALVLLIPSASATAPSASATARPTDAGRDGRPNILVVMTDDMAASDVAFMPNVQRLLAKKGTTFDNAITSFPLCCPSRATFITGQYAHNNGVYGNFAPYGWYGMADRDNTLPVWLDDAGYRTALIGKWLNGYGAVDVHGEVPAGFDTWRGLLDVSAYDYHNFVMNQDGDLRTWGDPEFARKLVEFASIQVDPAPDSLATIYGRLEELFGPRPYSYWGAENQEDYSPDVTGKMTTKLVRKEGNKRKPFFIWWSPAAPHREDVATTLMGRPGMDPRPPARYVDDVAGLTLPQPPSFNEPDIADKPSPVENAAAPLTQAQMEMLQLDYQGRAGSLMAVDDHVGNLVKTLRRTDQLRNTMIMFVSDNGWLQGEHRVTGDKFLPYEEALKVPLIIRGPGVKKGATVAGQVSNVDFAPTLLDFADAKAERTMDGLSLLPTLRKPRKRPDRVLGIEAMAPLFPGGMIPVNAWDQPYTGVRTDQYTYVVWTQSGETELYDRAADPYQLDNVSGDSAYAAIEADLAAKLAALQNCVGKACNVAP